MQPAIVVSDLGKHYRRTSTHRPRTFMEAALQGFRGLRPTSAEFWALQDVSFSVLPGQMLGILGHNGAGKSTLLQIISGIVRPDRGSVQVTGRMGALLDIGAGFHPDLTGRENVKISAVVGGLTAREAAAQFDAIVDFAELESALDNPLRTYSTGMQMRLGFAVAIHTLPDVLLIDEFLSVGDLAFQGKCLDRIMTLKNNGCAIVLISHNAEQVQHLCDQALWLQQGAVKAYGDPNAISDHYKGAMDLNAQAQQLHTYSKDVQIESVVALGLGNLNHQINTHSSNTHSSNSSTHSINSGDGVQFLIRYSSKQSFSNVIFSLSLCDEDGHIVFNTHTATASLTVPVYPGTGEVALMIDRLDLSGKQYYINVGVFAPDWSQTYDYQWQCYPFKIHWTPQEDSLLNPPKRWEILQSDRP